MTENNGVLGLNMPSFGTPGKADHWRMRAWLSGNTLRNLPRGELRKSSERLGHE
jgi:hypothetical protein